jgi:hypothetical protein
MAIDEINANACSARSWSLLSSIRRPTGRCSPPKTKHRTVIFGCWTSVSRKSVLPVVEEMNGLLFYPVQYEAKS